MRSVAAAASIVGAGKRQRQASVTWARPYRWIRRLEGAPASVGFVAAGPPDLALENRAQLLTALRQTMRDFGFEIDRIRRGFRHRMVIDGAEVLELIQSQEQSADAQSHWWVDDIVWRSRSGSAIVGVKDWDGNDLVFYGWGDDAVQCLGAVDSLLSGHVDGPNK